MTQFRPPEIIDNSTVTLAEVLCQTITSIGERSLDVATGYFAPSVWDLVGDAFTQLERFHLLMGERPSVPFGGDDRVDLRSYFRKKIAQDISELGYDRAHAALVDRLVEFLRRESVEVRHYMGSFLHAKAYIFEHESYVGSSNFTSNGLTRNSELLLSNREKSAADQLRAWFASKWAESADYKTELITLLEESKFGSKPYTPFEVFMKALYEYFKDRIALKSDLHSALELARFQEEGKMEAIRLLDRWGGVLVADAVGLGKTFIGLGLLEHELIGKRSRKRVPRALVVCPAQLRELVWEARLNEMGIPGVQVCSMEELGRANFDWKYWANHVDVVLVDESHNFRNPTTNRSQNLMKLLVGGRRKRVILMTATPVNNTVFDLYQQIMFLARGDERYYRKIGITNLKSYFKAVQAQSLEMFDLLEATTVRRSRIDVRKRQDAGEEIRINGQAVHFPRRRLERIEYDLTSTYGGFYLDLVNAIERLSLIAYNIEAFARQSTPESRKADQSNTALIALMKMLYLKRLESSAVAFSHSINRQADFQKRFLALLQQGKLLNAATFRKLVAIESDDEAEEDVKTILQSLPEVDPAGYRLDEIAEHIQGDIATLQTIVGMITRITEQTDAIVGDQKVQQLKHLLANELQRQKVLIFTSYQDTAVALHAALAKDPVWMQAAENPCVEMITGSASAEERRRLVQRFAPRANRPPDTDEEWQPTGKAIDILVCTDVLSEGQNLQDAGVIINYDLHWNPVRLIQRAGRVDRIGSRFAEIALYNVFPEAGLEALLGLVKRLSDRIQQIDRSVGLDASVLGEIVSERTLDQIRQIQRNDQQVIDDLERQAELVSSEEMKFPLLSYIQQIGESTIADIPLGIHSGKYFRANDARSGVFLAFKAGENHFWRFYPADGSEPLKSVNLIYPIIACEREEVRIDPGPPPYELIEEATKDILSALHASDVAAKTPPPMSAAVQKLYNWLNRPSLWVSSLNPAQLDRFNRVLEEVSLQPFKHDPFFKRLMKTYQTDEDFQQLVSDFDEFCTINSLYAQTSSDTATMEDIMDVKLELVCYEVLTSVRP